MSAGAAVLDVGAREPGTAPPAPPSWLLVGAPNVGKSALFGRLTGRYVAVSNYPGTSVEVVSGTARVGGGAVAVTDLPGMHGLLAVTEEERVARRAVLAHQGTLIIVLDASHLDRAIPLVLQLLQLGLPLVVACNVLDEARARGVAPDCRRLADRLGVPVVGTVATTGEGVTELVRAVRAATAPPDGWALPQPFAETVSLLADGKDGRGRVEAELALAGDPECLDGVALRPAWAAALQRRDAAWMSAEGFAVEVAIARRQMTLAILDEVVPGGLPAAGRTAALDRWLLSPWSGFAIVAAVLYFGMYRLVGGVAAGRVVDWLESTIFDGAAGRTLTALVQRVVPWSAIQDLIVGPYGLVTLGLRYAVAIVLPIVSVFFLVFAVLEDTGYLPRLALLMDRGLKRIGLSGRAVIPLVLGFGCGTMATLVTRTLETRRERLIATLLLALAVPCSAQLGVVLGILSVSPAAVGIWAATLAGVFIAVGWAAARLMPGAPPSFYLELPPLRLPLLRNVLVKTGTRTRWYLAEVLPLFLLASVLLWAGERTGLLARATAALVPVVRLVSLPDAAAPAFLYGFFRRDFGAAGLYDLAAHGALSVPALTTAAIVITLFVPCIAQFVMMRRERGLRTALAVLMTATVVAFVVGGAVGWALRLVGWT